MQSLTDVASLRAQLAAWRAAGETIALVPTMGHLHAGHYALIERARRAASRVVASIFVNPTQFGPGEDFQRYPRTLKADQAGLAAAGCDLLFIPTVATLYPFGTEQGVTVHVPGLTEVLEGAMRPGHFDGVATVVSKLFHLVEPDCAVFGTKDYQQLKVVERLVADMHWPLGIIGLATVRAEDGLALSSRNAYLNEPERALAPRLYQALAAMPAQVRQGLPFATIEAQSLRRLAADGFVVDYLTLRRQADLQPPPSTERHGLIALVAARLGTTRLIDNLPFDAT